MKNTIKQSSLIFQSFKDFELSLIFISFLLCFCFACQDQASSEVSPQTTVQSDWYSFYRLNSKADQIVADVLITEVQIQNQSTILDFDHEYSSWIEITNLRYDAINLKNWQIEVNGKTKKIDSKIKLRPQESTLIWFNRDKKDESYLSFKIDEKDRYSIKLISPKGEVKSIVDVPKLSPDLSWALIFNKWQVAFPTPYLENSFWRRQTGVEYQIEFNTQKFSNRKEAVEQFQSFISNANGKSQDWEDSIVARKLFDSSTLEPKDPVAQSNEIAMLDSFYLRYRVRLTEQDLDSFSWDDFDHQTRERDLTLKFPNISENFDRIAPQLNGSDDISYEAKRELNLYPSPKPQKLSYSIKAKDIEAIHTDHVEEFFEFFPDIDQRFGHQVEQLTFGDWRYDWQSCADLEIAQETNLCIKLSYLTLTDAILGNVEPLQVEISWKSSQADYVKERIKQMNDSFLEVLNNEFVKAE
jgi:hypothetical protein